MAVFSKRANSNFCIWLGIFICASFSFPMVSRASLAAWDNAAQGAYGDGWQSGDNGGSGWGGGWSLSSSGSSGYFIGTSANNGGGLGNIDTSGNSWGMYANSGGLASAVRTMNGSLSAGQSIILSMDNGYVQNGGTVGFGLQNSSGNDLFQFYFVGGGSEYTINTGSATGTGIGYTANGLQLTFTLGVDNSYSLTVVENDSTHNYSGSLSSSDISQIRFFNANAGSGSGNDLFFNNLQLVPEPISLALPIFGGVFLTAGAARHFLLRTKKMSV